MRNPATTIPVLIVLALCLVPPSHSLLKSFHSPTGLTTEHWSGAYRTPQRLLELSSTTLELTALTVLGSLLVGVPLGLLVFRTNLPGRRVWLPALGFGLLLPASLVVSAWMGLFGARGPLTPLLRTLFGPEADLVDSVFGAAWVQTLIYTPWVAVIVGVMSRRADADLEEAALLEAGTASVLWHVTRVRALPGILAAGAAVVILSQGELAVCDALRVSTATQEIYEQSHYGAAQAAAASALPLGLALAALAALALWLWRIGPASLEVSFSQPRRLQLGRWRWPLGLFVMTTMVIVALLPVTTLAWRAGLTYFPDRPATFSFAAVVRHVGAEFAAGAPDLGWTALAAGIAAVVATTLAVPTAWWLSRRGPGRTGVWIALIAAAALPGPLLGVAWAGLLNEPGWRDAAHHAGAGVVLAYLSRSLPFCVVVAWMIVRRLPTDLVEAAAVDGAGPGHILRRIVWPLSVPAAALAFAVALVLCVGELGASIIVSPAGRNTISVRLAQQLHSGMSQKFAAQCLVQLLVWLAAFGVGVAAWLARPKAD